MALAWFSTLLDPLIFHYATAHYHPTQWAEEAP